MEITSSEWIQAAVNIMDKSMEIGSSVYPLICGIGLIKMIINNV